MNKGIKIIDAHCHLHKPQWSPINLTDSKDIITSRLHETFDEHLILSNMKEEPIEKTIIFPLPSIYIDLEKANHYTVAISRKFPDQLIPFTIIDNKPDYWIENGVKGFKEHTYGLRIQKDDTGNDCFSQKFKETYAFMEHHHIPLLLHAGTNRIERLKTDIFKDTPNLIVILAHLGADFPENNHHRPIRDQVTRTLRELAEFPNLYFDISAISEPELIRAGLEIAGSQKLIFGSDFPYDKPVNVLRTLETLNDLSPTDKENILYTNISNILKRQDHTP
ncbi:MAG: amidohydrolase family protein [Candidatus Omnitrophota bacterium]